MKSIFTLISHNRVGMIPTVESVRLYDISKSDYELYVEYTNYYLEHNLLDEISTKIVESSHYVTNLVADLDPIENIPRLLRIIIETVINMNDIKTWYYMLSKLNNSTLLLLIGSFLITQEIIDILVEYYSNISINITTNTMMVSKLRDVCEENGFDFNTKDTSGEMNILMQALVLSSSIEDLQSLACTCGSIRRYIFEYISMINTPYPNIIT